MEKIVLIGGAPTSGKSYVARKIAEELNLPWISTDTVREIMWKTTRKEDYPALFLHAEPTIEMGIEFLNKNSPQEIVKIINKESADVWEGVKAIIENDYVWKSYIIEGVAILPKLVSRLSKKNKKIIALFIIDEDKNRIRESIFTRGLWDDAHKYPDNVKDKEVEWVLAFNDYIKKESKKYNFPLVSIGNRKDYIREIKKLIK